MSIPKYIPARVASRLHQLLDASALVASLSNEIDMRADSGPERAAAEHMRRAARLVREATDSIAAASRLLETQGVDHVSVEHGESLQAV
jgi:hypothetical protein